ncbi:MAG: pyridoxal phosphate-dependent aminotransferase [bacterium]|nr:pyridoxal phosphate-dependent aminotransferase [bacterium]
MIELSERVLQLKPSSTLAVTAKARELREAGCDVVSFGAGEPDFDTPANIVEAGCQALKQGKTRYENTAGTPAARQAVADYFRQRFQRSDVRSENVIISTGAKHALYIAFMALMNPGQELLLPAPYWVSYPAQAQLAGGTVKVIPGSLDNNFKITPEQLEKAITPQSKILMLCSPSNPAGIVYSRQELEGIAEVVLRHPQLMVFSDEIYERLVYNGLQFTSFASLSPEIAQRTVTFNGVSKSYAMTGWRVGYAVADEAIIKAMTKLQGHMTSSITACTMPALIEALAGPQDAVTEMVSQFAKRAEHIYKLITAIPGLKCAQPTGAFYILPDISALFGKKDREGQVLDTAASFAQSLLKHKYVAVVPGEDFGAPNHIRLSFATSLEQIDKGLQRLKEFVEELL